MADAAPATKNGHYVYNVTMTCSGCSGAVERVLKRVDGITYNVDLEGQLVTVDDPESKVGADALLEKIKKTGKKVNTLDRGDGQGAQAVAA